MFTIYVYLSPFLYIMSGMNQAIAVKMNKVESRMYEALEPVYIALQHNRDGVENLEALMVEVAEKLQGMKEIQVYFRSCNYFTPWYSM